MILKVGREKFVYQSEMQNIGECLCDVLINDHIDRWIVVFTELVKNPGPSVTNSIEIIIDQYCRFKGIPEDEVDFFERYQTHPDDLDLIKMQCGMPQWFRMPTEKAQPILEALR